MAKQFPPLFDAQFFDNYGTILTNGYLEAFIAGTTNHASIYNYEDNELSNPVQLDPSGRVQLKLDDEVAYDLKLWSSEMSLIRTIPNVTVVSGLGSSELTMDTITQGTSWKKLAAIDYNQLTGGGLTALHFHDYESISNPPSEFNPSAHASTHETGGSDVIAHNSIGPALVGLDENYGHINPSAQTIYGRKRFWNSADFGSGNELVTSAFYGDEGTQVNVQAGYNTSIVQLNGTNEDTTIVSATLNTSTEYKDASATMRVGDKNGRLDSKKVIISDASDSTQMVIGGFLNNTGTFDLPYQTGDYTLETKEDIANEVITDHLELSANCYDDWKFSPYARTIGANAATFVGVNDTGLYAWNFTNGKELFYTDLQLPHTYKEGTDLYPHIHFVPSTSETYTGTWTLEFADWITAQSGQTLGTKKTVTYSFDVALVAYRMVSADFSAVFSGTGRKISSMAIARLSLSLTAGTSLFVTGIDCHFIKNTLGSSSINTK